jgi:antitoxin MazE
LRLLASESIIILLVITLLIRQIRSGIILVQVVAMRAPVRKMGNSSGVILPKPILTQLGVEAGDDLDLSLDDGRIVLVRVKRHPRAGWADAAKRIAEAGDDALVWPEFGNASDADLKW